MSYASSRTSREQLFPLFLPLFLVKNVLLLSLGVACVQRAMTSSPVWWAGAVVALVLAVRLSLRFTSNSLKVGETHIVCRKGLIIMRVQTLPLWDLTVGCKQGLFGRLFDYGTIYLQTADRTVEFHDVANISAFHALVMTHQARLMMKLTPTQYQWLKHDPYRIPS